MHLIRVTLCLALLGIRTAAFSDAVAVPTSQPPPYTHTHLVSSTLWEGHLETFQKLFMTTPEAARTELENVAKKLFRGHLLSEEWVPLYFRLSRDGTEHLSDVRRVSELEIRMLTALNAKKHAEPIRQHQAALERYQQNAGRDTPKKPRADSKELSVAKKLRTENLDKHAAAYEKCLPTDLEAARAELVKYAQVTFGEHSLREEWIELYFKLSREKKATLSESIQTLTLAKQMLEDNFPEIAAAAIASLDSALKTFKGISPLIGETEEKVRFQFSLSGLK